MASHETETNAWAVGFILMAIVLLSMLSCMLIIMGFAILLDNKVLEATDGYALDVSPTTQGWGLFLGGILTAAAAIFLMLGKAWARWLTVGIAAIVTLLNFATLPGHPAWSLVVIGLNLGIIWALALHSQELAE